MLTLALLLAVQVPTDPCREPPPHSASADLYCLELIAAPGAPAGITGHAILDLAPGPFVLNVDRDGTVRYRPRLVLAGLPDPRVIDPAARHYVAWATTPLYGTWQRLGVVQNGTTPVATVALDQFIVVVSAEPDTTATGRRGRPLLRGGSPSTRLQPPDFLNFATGLIGLSDEDLARATGGHAHHDAGDGWGSGVPMVPGFAMLPAEMLLRPNARPLRVPALDANAPPASKRTEVVRLADGDTLTLVAGSVTKRIHGRDHVLLAFNGQIPGPLLWVERGTSVHVRFVNRLTMPSTVHWHGLRHDFRMDGVPGLSQEPVPPGESFDYTLRFPDAGLFWYHPHVREDVQQDLGLSGNIAVRGMEGLPSVAREEILLLDDILISDDGVVPYGDDAVTHALMGRFGNVFLVNGEPRWQGTAASGETVRFWFTNAANTRTFNLSIPGATLRVVAADLGPFGRAEPVESVVLAPAERYAVDVTFEGDGPWHLVNRVKALDHLFGRFVQQEDTLGVMQRATGDGRPATGAMRDVNPVAPASPESLPVARRLSPDFVFEFGLRTHDLPFVTKRMMVLDSTYFHPVEWSGTMPMMNWATTSRQAEWFVRDAATGRENADASFTVRRGERKVLRLVNLRGSLHAMQHPIHLHGQRFQVLAVNGVPATNRAWKDTVLLPAGSSVDIVVEFTNPGHWMMHCHIAEHMEAGMMTHFTVE